MQILDEFDAALGAEVDIDKGHIRIEVPDEPDGLGTRGRRPDDADSIDLEQFACGSDESGVVIDDQTAHSPPPTIMSSSFHRTDVPPFRLAANDPLWGLTGMD